MHGKVLTKLILLLLFQTSGEQQTDNKFQRDKYDSTTAILLLFLYGTVLAGVVTKYILELLHIPIPFQIFILALGVMVGFLGQKYQAFTQEFLMAIGGKNEYLLILALPVLIFKLCLCMEVHSFMRCLPQVMIISIPCTLINGFIVGFIMRLVENSSDWDFQLGIMYGFTCVATYPQETLTYLKDLGSKGKHLADILEGESVFGTAVCIIMILAALKHYIGFLWTLNHYLIFVFQFILGGIVLGCISGFCLSGLMRLFYNDAINIMIATISAPFMVYYLGIYVFKVCAILALIIVGIFMSFQRTELAPEIDSSLVYFWELITLILNSVVYALNGVVLGKDVLRHIELSDFVKIAIAYMVIYFTRFATFIAFSTITGRLEYGISFRQMIMAAWGGLRGAITLCLVMICYQEQETLDVFKDTVLVHINGVVFLSLLINVPTIPALLSCLGISNLSMARLHNMNNCVQYIMTKRDRIIALLKMDRFLADANWSLVNTSTEIKHPYTGHRDLEGDNDYSMGLRGSICPDCHKEVANQPTQREIEEMKREARMRVLKAKKISYARQYESGMLSKEAIAALTHAVETAQNNEDNYLRIENLLKLFKKKMILMRIRNRLMRYFHKKISSRTPKAPRKPRRRLFYNVVLHPGYLAVNYVITICNVACCSYELTLFDYKTEYLQMCVMKGLNWTFFLYFVSDIIAKIYGYSYVHIWPDGVQTFFKDLWHGFDVFLLLVNITDLVIDALDFWNIFYKYESFKNKSIIFIKLTRVLRLLKIITLCQIFQPLLVKFCDMKIDSRLSTVYDIGKGFVKGEEEVLEMLDQMIPNKEIRQEMRRRMESDKLMITRELGLLQKEKPWIAVTVKTKQAIRTILNNMETAIEDLRSSGWIDHIEYKKLIESLNDKKKYVRRMKTINSSPPKIIFQEILWMGEDVQFIDFLFSKVISKIYEPGDLICVDGDKPIGIFIIITGLFKSTYKPDRKVLDAVQDYGVLPVMDYISSTRFDRIIEEYIVSGNSVGELSFLTDRPYNATVTADTPSQVFILPTELLREASKKHPDILNGFEARMWKYVSLRLAVSILLKTPAYSTSTQEKLRYALERSFVPNLENFKVFINNTMIEDIVLIEGVLIDTNTKENYTAPCYIPRTVQKLSLVRNSLGDLGLSIQTKILIIPTKDVEPSDIMESEEDMAELYQKADVLQDYGIGRPSRLYKRKRRPRTSFVGSNRSGRHDISDTLSYSRSNLFSMRSRLASREFEMPEFRKRSIFMNESFDNSISLTSDPLHLHTAHLRQFAEVESSIPMGESTEVFDTEQASPKPGKRLSMRPAKPIIVNVPLREDDVTESGGQSDRTFSEDLNQEHPFSINEDVEMEQKGKKKPFKKS
ncbi:hypothetical protein HHI36_011804 [Cryptolaemus montrouzieri]|uniref:Cyclic nucleotide-binding domain-containing protein n=1 Tax=Cryptolaemus montrouzieri TaxID=559131 RepID=A0ABD2NCX1_9CUCU